MAGGAELFCDMAVTNRRRGRTARLLIGEITGRTTLAGGAELFCDMACSNLIAVLRVLSGGRGYGRDGERVGERKNEDVEKIGWHKKGDNR